ncbi:peptidase [Brasilonema octagenarum UFV-E1]|uniref:Peptidase n=2 Tax=Brasilonema TaxID=383614 RepID=A0A856MKS3_9CYAN|nr:MULTISPECIES: pre-peptidase C-terminal domain-containing protein [Brasilonema]NMF63030.1 peptidase [Brasilonema octagenarum UFV-OR1]QDL10740.1 peptidase [Brasilonema sennae CENA114]QDL17084.1 peptidase [Brasilonema octagenarum UFV-E1]
MAIQNINLGTLSETPTPVEHHSVNSSEPYDTYRFRLDSPGNINLSLTGTSADADVVLYRDVNNNGVIDDGVDTWIQNSTFGYNEAHDEAINVVAEAGNYIAKVYSFNDNSTDYDLRLSTTRSYSTTPSNLLSKEFTAGDWTGIFQDQTFNGSLGDSNTSDLYYFHLLRIGGSVGSDTISSITLSGLSNDADIRLIRDSNNNRIVDAGEEIDKSQNLGTANDTIFNINQGGSYYLQVYQYSGSTDYTLNFDYTYVPPA